MSFLEWLQREHMGNDLGHLTYTVIAGFVVLPFLGLPAATLTVVGIGVVKEVIQAIRNIPAGDFDFLDSFADLISHFAALPFMYYVAQDWGTMASSIVIALGFYTLPRVAQYEMLD